jgi:hypothetical protein
MPDFESRHALSNLCDYTSAIITDLVRETETSRVSHLPAA